jgi:hypothetical protein
MASLVEDRCHPHLYPSDPKDMLKHSPPVMTSLSLCMRPSWTYPTVTWSTLGVQSCSSRKDKKSMNINLNQTLQLAFNE